MAFGFAAYVSRCWLPVTAQDWLPGAGQALLGRLSPAGLRQKVFNSRHVRWPPFPSFLAQSRSLSELVNTAVREALAEDAEDLAAFEERAGEPLVSFQDMLKRLKADGRL